MSSNIKYHLYLSEDERCTGSHTIHSMFQDTKAYPNSMKIFTVQNLRRSKIPDYVTGTPTLVLLEKQTAYQGDDVIRYLSDLIEKSKATLPPPPPIKTQGEGDKSSLDVTTLLEQSGALRPEQPINRRQ